MSFPASRGTHRTDVVVVGAGPTGLTLAVGLLRFGVRVRVVERAERPHPHSKAITLWPRAMEVLAELGAEPDIIERGLPIRAAVYYNGPHQVARMVMHPLRGTRFPGPISLAQSETEAILRRLFVELGGTVEYGRHLVHAEQGEEGVTAVLADGDTVRADWLVGCDGSRSRVRELLGIPFEGAAYEQVFGLVDGDYETELPIDEAHYFMGESGVVVVVGLPDERRRVFTNIPADTAPGNLTMQVERILHDRCPVPIRLVQAHGSGVFRIQRRLARRMWSGRMLLAGDAAHVHSPAGGQGLNTSIQDAHALSWRLAALVHGTGCDTDLAEWEQERRFVASQVIADTDRQTAMWMLAGWRGRIRSVALTVAATSGLLSRVLNRRMAQLSIAFPTSEPGFGPLRPGMRLPDVRLPTGGWLRDELQHAGHLVVLAGRSTTVAPLLSRLRSRDHRTCVLVDRPDSRGEWQCDTVVADPDGRLASQIGLRAGGALLVRPDGVIRLARPLTDPEVIPDINHRLTGYADTQKERL
jgi:2-polyprenyl-6-methoxyphenol hydroxylase-like FAD-dependent oxidoreductase